MENPDLIRSTLWCDNIYLFTHTVNARFKKKHELVVFIVNARTKLSEGRGVAATTCQLKERKGKCVTSGRLVLLSLYNSLLTPARTTHWTAAGLIFPALCKFRSTAHMAKLNTICFLSVRFLLRKWLGTIGGLVCNDF